jgi:hypothetical protein
MRRILIIDNVRTLRINLKSVKLLKSEIMR